MDGTGARSRGRCPTCCATRSCTAKIPLAGAASTLETLEEADHLGREVLRPLQRGEVAAVAHHAPAPDIGIRLRREGARWLENFLRELGVPGGHAYRVEGPWPVHARLVGP